MSAPTFTREAQAGDLQQIANVLIEARTRCLGFLNWEYPLQVIMDVLGSQMSCANFHLAEVGGDVVGFIAFTGDEIEHLYVLPEFHGLGVGRTLLRLATADTRDDIRLWAFRDNLQARRFYERNGFAVEYETDGSNNMEKVPDVRYVLRPR